MTSDGLQARIGSQTANLERFMPWRTVDGQTIAPKGAPELETLLLGVFAPQRFLALVRDFAVFADKGDGLVKIIAGHHQSVRLAMVKAIPRGAQRAKDRDLAIQQIVSRAVVSTELVDIMQAAGLQSPDISVLSDEFLAEVQGMEKKNLAAEALRKLLNGESWVTRSSGSSRPCCSTSSRRT